MAGGKNHAKRADPERTGPNRAARGTGGGSTSGGPDASRRAANHREVIDRAVKLAYDVVDDHIVQGRRAAERLRQGTYSSADFDDDLRQCLDRALRLSKDLGVVGVDFLDVMRRRAGSRAASDPSAPEAALEVNSKRRRAEVKFHIRPGVRGFNPSVPPIHSADQHKAALSDVRFELREGSRPVLVVNIPEDQPPGIYHGAIVDSKTHEPQGFISVRVLKEDNQ
jgi:hypothetical protein